MLSPFPAVRLQRPHFLTALPYSLHLESEVLLVAAFGTKSRYWQARLRRLLSSPGDRGYAFASESFFRNAASPAVDTSTHFWFGAASAS